MKVASFEAIALSARLTLREKLQAVEEMAELTRRLHGERLERLLRLRRR